MRIHTQTTWEIAEGGSLRLLSDSWYEYSGPVIFAKKGRKEQEQIMRENIARSAEDRARAEAERLSAEPFVSGLESTAPGAMSSLAAAQYASEMDRIGKTYSGIREASLRSLGARGFGRAPSGFTTSAVNTAAEQQGRTETDAYRQGLARTYEQGLQALAY